MVCVTLEYDINRKAYGCLTLLNLYKNILNSDTSNDEICCH